jgi:MFS family permease
MRGPARDDARGPRRTFIRRAAAPATIRGNPLADTAQFLDTAAGRPARELTGAPRAWAVAAVAAGAGLELFDFLAYAFFAADIGKAFFPASTPMASLLLSLAVFGVGFATRPLGAILMGAYADRAGRRPALLLSMSVITLGTLGLALTPTYAAIGMAAPAIVVACRLAQGLAYGGEFGPASAFLFEIAPDGRRALFGSWQFASQGLASVAAGGFGMAVVGLLAPADVQAWGWRLPFAFSLLMLPIVAILRRSMPETGGGAPADPRGARNAARRLRGQAKLLGLFLLLIMGGTVPTYVGSYMATYSIAVLKLPPVVGMASAVAVGLSTLFFSLAGGWLADRFGRKPVMLIPRVVCALAAYPAFSLLVDRKTPAALLGVGALLAALNAISNAAALATILELLPRGARALGSSIAYAVGVAVFGGAPQFVATWLIAASGDAAAPAWPIAFSSALAACAMLALPESRGRDIAL